MGLRKKDVFSFKTPNVFVSRVGHNFRGKERGKKVVFTNDFILRGFYEWEKGEKKS